MDAVTSDNKISILNAFHNKNVLILGATGFLGKVLFAMILEKVPTIKGIYLLIRDKNEQNVLDRFTKEILFSPVFEPARKKNTVSFERLIKDKVKIIHGDVSFPGLGMNKENYDYLTQKIDLVINCTGLVDFFPEVERSFAINTLGAIHAAEFTRNCVEAKLIQISTCYVAPSQDGKYDEEMLLIKSKSGLVLDVDDEITDLLNSIKEIKNNNLSEEEKYQAQVNLGASRTEFWGFNNTYCYTKALAEAAITKLFSDVSIAIVRPTIIESAMSFPKKGWNEGFNTTSPLCYLAGGWYPYIVCRDKINIDIIPVDVVCQNILLIASTLMTNEAEKIYQISTSSTNPLNMEQIMYYARSWHQRNRIDSLDGKMGHYLRTFKKLSAINQEHFLSPQRLAESLVKVSKLVDVLIPVKALRSRVNQPITKCSKLLTKIAKIHQVFQPFINDRQYVFTANAIEKIQPLELEFHSNVAELNWKYYWHNVHLPGLAQWIFPHYKAKTYKQRIYNAEYKLNISLDSVVLKESVD
jgi:long-chain acyl-CoA synthetase